MKAPLPLVIAIVGIAAAPLLLPDYYVTLMNYVGLASLVALGLVLLTGIAGLTSFGQAAFVGLGAYVTAVVTTRYGWSPWLGLAIGAAHVAVAGGIVWRTLNRFNRVVGRAEQHGEAPAPSPSLTPSLAAS